MGVIMSIDTLIRKYGLCFKTLNEGDFVLSSTIPIDECDDEDAFYIKQHCDEIVQYLVEEKFQYNINMGFIDAFFTYFSREKRAAPLICKANAIIDGEYDDCDNITITDDKLKEMYKNYGFPISKKIIGDGIKDKELLDENLLLLCEKAVNAVIENPKQSDPIVAIALNEARAIAYDRYLFT
jgi:hypothetical protein